MTTKAQKMANQKNALLSTGPKSQQGKSIASLNSLKHGLLTKKLVLKEENCKELQLLREQYYAVLNPFGAIEELMVEKIINAAWRLQRLTKAETEAFEEKDYCYGSSRRLIQAFSGMNGVLRCRCRNGIFIIDIHHWRFRRRRYLAWRHGRGSEERSCVATAAVLPEPEYS